MKFFLNPSNPISESLSIKQSTNSVRVELNSHTEASLLSSKSAGRTVEYRANVNHSLFDEIHSIVKKYSGIDQIIEKLISRLGDVQSAYLVGDYAKGQDSGLIDIILIGEIDKAELEHIAERRGKDISRKIRPMVITKKELITLWNVLDM